MLLTLERRVFRDYGTLGLLTVLDCKKDVAQWHTLERPWVESSTGGYGGRKGVSRIPPGAYFLQPHQSEAHGKTWVLSSPVNDVYPYPGDVPADVSERTDDARTAVLFHAANDVWELRGCIAPGVTRYLSSTRAAVLDSRKAMAQLRAALPWREHDLLVMDRRSS